MAQDFDRLLEALTGMNGGLPTVDASQLQSVQPQIQQSNTPTAPNNDMGKIGQILNEMKNNQQDNTSSNGSVLSILSQRFQPTMQDAADTGLNNTLSLLIPGNYKPTTMEEQTQKRVSNELAPYTTMMGLQEKQADTEMKLAHAKAYGGTGGGGVLGAQVQMLMQDNPGMTFTQAFQLAQTGMRKGVQYDANGKIVPIAGMAEALGALKEGEVSGKERSETSFSRQKAQEEAGGKATVTAMTDINKTLDELNGMETSIAGLREAVKDTGYTGPIAGRIGALIQEPSRTSLISAQNELTLRAKSLLNMPSNNFSDADRDFLLQIAGGSYGRKGGILAVVDRMEETTRKQKEYLLSKKNAFGGNAQQPSLTGVAGMGVSQPLSTGATHAYNPATGMVEEIK
jgi:hypothetical protein